MKQAGRFKLCQRGGRQALGSGLAALLYLALQILAISPHLHHLIHEDSPQPDHQCAIKLVSDGQVDIEPSGTGLPVLVAFFFVAQPPGEVLVSSLISQLPPGRAPPVSLL